MLYSADNTNRLKGHRKWIFLEKFIQWEDISADLFIVMINREEKPDTKLFPVWESLSENDIDSQISEFHHNHVHLSLQSIDDLLPREDKDSYNN